LIPPILQHVKVPLLPAGTSLHYQKGGSIVGDQLYSQTLAISQLTSQPHKLEKKSHDYQELQFVKSW
jgi:hypothetical protein